MSLRRTGGLREGVLVLVFVSHCEKHSVANNLSSGEDLSEVAILFTIAMVGVPQAEAHLLVTQYSLYTLFLDDWDPPLLPIDRIIQVHKLSDASQTTHGLQLLAC